MLEKDVKIGDRVVPHTQSGSGIGWDHIKIHKFSKQGYLTVDGKCDCGCGCYVLGGYTGFYASDFEPYIEPTKDPCLSDATKKLINKEIDKRITEMCQSIPALVLAGMANQDKPAEVKPLTFEVGETVKIIGSAYGFGKFHYQEMGKIEESHKPSNGNYRVFGYWFPDSSLEKVPQPTKHDKLTLHDTVAEMIKGNQGLIPAIRYYREQMDCGLLEAKIYVDKISAEIQPTNLEVFIGGVKYVREEMK